MSLPFANFFNVKIYHKINFGKILPNEMLSNGSESEIYVFLILNDLSLSMRFLNEDALKSTRLYREHIHSW